MITIISIISIIISLGLLFFLKNGLIEPDFNLPRKLIKSPFKIKRVYLFLLIMVSFIPILNIIVLGITFLSILANIDIKVNPTFLNRIKNTK